MPATPKIPPTIACDVETGKLKMVMKVTVKPEAKLQMKTSLAFCSTKDERR